MATQTDKGLAVSLIKELFEMPDFRSEVLKLVASVVHPCSNVPEPMHVSVESNVSTTGVSACKSADCSSSHEADAVAAKFVSAATQKIAANANKAKPSSEHTKVVTATDRVQNSHNTDLKMIKKIVRRPGANTAHNGRHSSS